MWKVTNFVKMHKTMLGQKRNLNERQIHNGKIYFDSDMKILIYQYRPERNKPLTHLQPCFFSPSLFLFQQLTLANSLSLPCSELQV